VRWFTSRARESYIPSCSIFAIRATLQDPPTASSATEHSHSMSPPMDEQQGKSLVSLARVALEEYFARGEHGSADGDPPWLREQGACFVTLTTRGELRGCIGSIEARRALGEDVRSNAVAAATRDPRFAPVRPGDQSTLAISVSAISPLELLQVHDEADAIAKLRPGIDGIVVSHGWRRGTLLPKVWEHLPDPTLFLRMVKQKAGLPARFWDDQIRIERYTADEWQEPAFSLDES
jgi:AmmeMemoRadiSam system protein A